MQCPPRAVPRVMERTSQWAAPEVIEDHPYTAAADVYATAITVWECFGGEIPYEGMWPAQVEMEVIAVNEHGIGMRPQIPTTMPQDIAEAVQRAWAQKPRDRPSLKELWRLLEHYRARVEGRLVQTFDEQFRKYDGNTPATVEQEQEEKELLGEVVRLAELDPEHRESLPDCPRDSAKSSQDHLRDSYS